MGFEITTTANGELEARNKVEIRSPLDQESTIVRIVAEGTRVKAGDVLIQLNVEEIQLKVDEEKLKVESARADAEVAQNAHEIQAKTSESELRQAQLKVELAELALRQWAQGDVLKKYRVLELDADKAALELQRLADVYIRSQELNSEGFLSKDQMDKDEVSYIEAISGYKTSKLSLEVYQNYERIKDQKKFESDVAEAREELEKAKLNSKSQLASKLAEMNNSREQLAGLERKLAKLSKQRDDATIRAERDGLVVYGTSVDKNSMGGRGGGGDSTLAIGTQIYPNQLLMILPDTSEMLAAVRVHESLAGRIRKGQDVNVKIDAAGGVTFAGKVESVGVMAEGGGWRDPNLREYTVRVALDTQGSQNLKPAMRCEARIILDSVTDAVTVPVQAVFNEGAVQFVYSPLGNKFTRMPVRIGRRSDTIAEIAKGLQDGQLVLVREPAAGEVLAAPFAKESLLAAGYKLDDQGKVVAEGGMRGMGGGAGGPGRPAGTGQAGAVEPVADRAAPGGAGDAAKGKNRPKRDSKGDGKGEAAGDKPVATKEATEAAQAPTQPAGATTEPAAGSEPAKSPPVGQKQ
ncbi:MAG: HlyD family efflux transporter periplasmic adaptor subunit [Planctomycetota bacterium]|nr:HlyD family efflux transporter periplasmic adaptor subunit [Planctomycetota bacterium]